MTIYEQSRLIIRIFYVRVTRLALSTYSQSHLLGLLLDCLPSEYLLLRYLLYNLYIIPSTLVQLSQHPARHMTLTHSQNM